MTDKSSKVRLSVDCLHEERRKIKVFSAMADSSVSEWVMDCVRERISRMEAHIPNSETEKALEESDAGRGVKSYKTTGELFDDLGI